MFSLEAIAALAANTPLQAKTLSGNTVCVILTALHYAENLENWRESDLELTSDQIEDIRRMVDNALDEMMAGW